MQRRSRFQKTVLEHFRTQGRHSLPWRSERDPYRILVSEMMLQQTQVDRVIPKYKEFLKKFPTIRALAESQLGEVIKAWQGLGYNRRAKYLHECAKIVTKEHGGLLPGDEAALVSLPGIGRYTARAVLAFAHNKPLACIETNIRTVYLHHFFAGRKKVSDKELLALIERTLDVNGPRKWYAALMDYGAYLKQNGVRVNDKSRQYSRQSKFKGSDREIRGAILRALSVRAKREKQLITELGFDSARSKKQIMALLKEGFIKRFRGTLNLFSS